ncbi:MAG TPA: NAD(P)/FAD-dependent oxidoreductase [Candidatus Dorea intestinavium]|nr:NAD(P)/FAD-dependent oxidoreductase [Candidatus Dorea intestinavium]
MSKVVIVGNGPAGISAALYTKRSGLDTVIIGKDNGALHKAHKIENYYGFEEPVSGDQLIHNGIEQAKRLGVSFEQDEVVGIEYGKGLLVKTTTGEEEADAVILATGTGRTTPKIAGLKEFEGKGISYCATCDGFFHRGKDVAVLGHSEYALAEAKALLPIVGSVTIVTNGATPIEKIPAEIKVITTKIEKIQGDDFVESIEFVDGSTLAISGLFVAVGVAGSSDLAKKLGASVDGKKIVVNENMQTNIPGLYAAGDCTGGMLQISKSVYEGAKAGSQVSKYLRKQANIA